MKPCLCKNPKVCTLGPKLCTFCFKMGRVHCTECGRPIREEKVTTTATDGEMTYMKAPPFHEPASAVSQSPVQEPSEEEPVPTFTDAMLSKREPSRERFSSLAINHIEKKVRDEFCKVVLQEPSEGFKKALESLDWQGIAEVFAQADTKWHAGEWRAFIEKIKADERTKLLSEIAEKMRQMGNNIQRYPSSN